MLSTAAATYLQVQRQLINTAQGNAQVYDERCLYPILSSHPYQRRIAVIANLQLKGMQRVFISIETEKDFCIWNNYY